MALDLTILLFSYRKSEVYAWLRKHEYLAFDSIRLLCAYHKNDVPRDPLLEERFYFVQGAESGFTRIRQCLDDIETQYVMLAAGDDQILKLPDARFSPRASAVAGSFFMQHNSYLSPSSNNSIQFAGNREDALLQYWTCPNPGDNCLFYSIFNANEFRRIFAETGEYEGSDWYLVHRCLSELTFERSERFIVVRQPPPLANHYTVRFLDRLPRRVKNTNNWQYKNPILNCLENVARVTPPELTHPLRPLWAKWLKLKFLEMAEASPAYRSLINKNDLDETSQMLATMLGDIEESLLVNA